MPALLAGAPSRVVNLASNAHRLSGIVFDDPMFTAPGSYKPFTAYGQSKTANILHAVELNKRLSASGITAVALHPGVIETELWRHAGTVVTINKTIPQVASCRVLVSDAGVGSWALGVGCVGCGLSWREWPRRGMSSDLHAWACLPMVMA